MSGKLWLDDMITPQQFDEAIEKMRAIAKHTEEIERLRTRVDGLLMANNREVERRRKAESGRALLRKLCVTVSNLDYLDSELRISVDSWLNENPDE